jgi:hypothetical protein
MIHSPDSGLACEGEESVPNPGSPSSQESAGTGSSQELPLHQSVLNPDKKTLSSWYFGSIDAPPSLWEVISTLRDYMQKNTFPIRKYGMA